MKMPNMFSMQQEMKIESDAGRLEAAWKHDLEDEEFEGYLPDGYDKKVLELQIIEAARIGQGDGDALMKEFLDSPMAQSAELIFLDPVPHIGQFSDSPVEDHIQIEKLQAFYRKYGFRNNPGSSRMWLVRHGEIADADLPT